MEQQNQPQMQINQGNEGMQHMNHGGHEVFDMHEVLSGMIGVLEQYMMFREHVKDPEPARHFGQAASVYFVSVQHYDRMFQNGAKAESGNGNVYDERGPQIRLRFKRCPAETTEAICAGY